MNTRPASYAALVLACGLAQPAAVGARDLPAVEVHARALQPGEPLRIDVTHPAALDSVSGEFDGRELFFVRVRPHRWSAWEMIDLDRDPGKTRIEIRATPEGGATIKAARRVSIEAKRFPSEALTVASQYVEPPPEVRTRLDRERELLGLAYRQRRKALSTGPFVRPVPGPSTSVFGTRRVFNGKPRAPHAGIDLDAEVGTPVLSSGAGRVVLARELYFSGNTILIDHGAGLFTIYAHLSEIDVERGRPVAAGEVIGLSGATGRVTGPHLHWGAKIGNRPFDPTALLDRRLFPQRAEPTQASAPLPSSRRPPRP